MMIVSRCSVRAPDSDVWFRSRVVAAVARTAIADVPIEVALSAPVTSTDVARLLAPYSHVACCPRCREYAADHLDGQPGAQLLTAVLDHHDSAHRSDPLRRPNAQF
jgi:hypothetical protein